MMPIRRPGAILAVLVAAALAGCSQSLATPPSGDATAGPSTTASAPTGDSPAPSVPAASASPTGDPPRTASPYGDTTIAVTIDGDAMASVELVLQVDFLAWRIPPGARAARVLVPTDAADMVGDLDVMVTGPRCLTYARVSVTRGSARTIAFDGTSWAIHDGDAAPPTAAAPQATSWLRCNIPPGRDDHCFRDAALDAFAKALLADIASRDPGRVASRMGDRFDLLVAQSDVEATVIPSTAARTLVGRPYLVATDRLGCDPDMPAELAAGGGSFAGRYVAAVRTTGWGTAGGDEAFVYLARRANGDLYWLGMLYAFGGFRSSATILCPASPAAVPQMLFANAERCGNREVSVRGWLASAWGIGGLSNGIEPAWLGEWGTDPVLWAGPAGSLPGGGASEWDFVFIFLHVRPGSGLVLGPPARWVELTGHFADPTAALCRFVSDAPWRDPNLVGADPVELCRDMFVARSVRTIAAP